MDVNVILNIIGWVFAGLSTIIGGVTSILTKQKVNKSNDKMTLTERMYERMAEAEDYFAIQRNQGIDVSQMKKKYVMDDLRIYALTNKQEFDEQLWSAEIERAIEFSKKVNAKK